MSKVATKTSCRKQKVPVKLKALAKTSKAAPKGKTAKRSTTARSSGANRLNRQFAKRRITAWRLWDEQQDAELATALTALAGYGRPVLPSRGGRPSSLVASYDAAAVADGNFRHWANSDTRGAVSANSPAIRATLRRRSRYEVANNCTARGILLTKAYDLIGRGPRVQFDTGNRDANSLLEAEFAKWAKVAKLAEKLRTATVAKTQDGETFGMFVTNGQLRHPVKVDVRLFEAEQVADPANTIPTRNRADGILFDDEGNPTGYCLLSEHPGEPSLTPRPTEHRIIPADDMVHWFRTDRPGQIRGIPEITPALPLMAQCRRFIMATLDAAEAAADFAVLLYTEMPPYTLDGGEQVATPVTPMASFDMERRMMTAVPAGWKAAQMKAEHPSTTYAMFKKSMVNDFGRCLCMPYGVAAGDSSEYNFASGRLDLLPYRKSLQIEQAELEADWLDRLVAKWLEEALIRFSILYPAVAIVDARRVAWNFVWDSVGYGVNPVDEANARRVDIETGLSNRPREYERAGLDWEAEDQRAAESYGVTVQEYRERLFLAHFADKSKPQSDANQQDEKQQANQRQKRQAEEQQATAQRSKS